MPPEITLFDIVTSDTSFNMVSLKNKMFTVVGTEKLEGFFQEFGDLWILKDLRTDEEVKCFGKDITVWKPVNKGKNMASIPGVTPNNPHEDGNYSIPPNEGRILTCVYCGMEYPQNTPASGSAVLTDHIRICSKHPLRKAEETIAKLRKAVEGFVGASDPKELEAMKATMMTMVAITHNPDIQKGIDAINALLELGNS